MITPGCRFTGDVVEALAFFICQRLSSRKYEHVKFYVSGANVAGEGELKIMKYIKSMSESARQSDVFCLVGSDADLVLLAIASKVHHVSILNALSSTSQKLVASLPTLPPRTDRRDHHDAGKKGGHGSRKGPHGDIFIEIEIDKLSRDFSQLLPNANADDVGTDFVALSILSGNDYLPKVPSYFIDQYWNHYLRARRGPHWANANVVDPPTGRLNLPFLDFLLSHSGNRGLTAPPIHHHRKLVRLRKLRADILSGAIDVEEIRKKYATVTDEDEDPEAGNNGISEEARKEMSGLLTEDGDDDASKMNLDDEEDELDDDAEIAGNALSTGSQSASNAQAAGGKSNKGGNAKTSGAPESASSASSAAPGLRENTTQSGKANQGSSNQQQQQPRDPLDIFLDHSSKDTWADYDKDDHAAQFIYGVEWVIQSYLRGESVSYDWFFPYSSAPAPKELREWIAKAKVNPNIVMSLPSRDAPTVAGSEQISKAASSATAPTLAAPVASKRSSDIPPEPWMFAMMLLDSTTYNYLSPSIPTHTVAPGSYVHEVHDPSYFFGYIDSQKMEEELTRMDVSAMSLEDSAYSHLGPINMFERSYDRSNRDTSAHYVPRSPFGERENLPPHMLFRRTPIADLHTHHHQADANSRQRGGGNQHNQGYQAARSDSRYQSQQGYRGQQPHHGGQESHSQPPRQHQPHQQQRDHQGGRQQSQGPRQPHSQQGGSQPHGSGAHQQRGNTQGNQGNRHQHSGASQNQGSGESQQTRNISTSAQSSQSYEKNDRRNNTGGKRDARGKQKSFASDAAPSSSGMQVDHSSHQADPHNATQGQRVDLGSLFVPQGQVNAAPFMPFLPTFPPHGMVPQPGQFPDPMMSNGFQPFYPIAPQGVSQTAPLLSGASGFPPTFPSALGPAQGGAPMPFPYQMPMMNTSNFSSNAAAPQSSQPSNSTPLIFPPVSNGANPFI